MHLSLILDEKLFDLTLDEKLTFNYHVTSELTIVFELTINLRKLYHYIPRYYLLTIYISFLRLHKNYTNVIFVDDLRINEMSFLVILVQLTQRF